MKLCTTGGIFHLMIVTVNRTEKRDQVKTEFFNVVK